MMSTLYWTSSRGGRQGRQISLREADAYNELFVLAVAQLQQTVS